MKLIPLLCALLTVLTGCHISKDDKITIVKVTPDFQVRMFEELGVTPRFQFLVNTIESQPCENATINYSTQNFSDYVTLWLYGISQPEHCIFKPAPAKVTATVGALNEGKYEVRMNLKNAITNTGMLKVNSDAYTLTMNSHDGLEIPYFVLKRIPPRMIWGYVGYNDKNAAGDYPDNFMQDLKNLSRNAALPAGQYGYFAIEQNTAGPVFDPKPAFNNFKTFIHMYEGSKETLESLLEFYRNGPAGSYLTIQLFTWEGESL